MATVWGRLRAVSSTEVLQLPLNKKQRREDAVRAADQGASDKAFWQYNFDSRLNALGIKPTGTETYPYRYEIQKGKTVPRYGDADERPKLDRSPSVPWNEHDESHSPVFAPPPPRNPLRRLRSDPDWRPTSSIYDVDIAAASPSAVPSPLQVSSAKMDPRAGGFQISPPSSPDIDSRVRQPSPEDVSPIDDEFGMTQQNESRGHRPSAQVQLQATPKAHASPPRSSIPTLRRDRRKQHDAALATSRETKAKDNRAPSVRQPPISHGQSEGIPRSHGMRWDQEGAPVYGKGNLSPPPAAELPMGSTTIISGPARSPRSQHSPSFGERVRQFGIVRPKPEPLDSRPAWNGASGRSALVQPVRDDLGVAPLQAPPKHTKRIGRGHANMAIAPGPSETTSSPAAQTRAMQHHLNGSHKAPKQYALAQPVTTSSQDNGAQSYPSPPYSGSPMRMSPETAQPLPHTLLSDNTSAVQMPVPPSAIPHAEKAIRRKPPPTHANRNHPAQGSLSTNLPQGANRESSGLKEDDDGWVQPPSRFSISTRATSHTTSPRPSEDEDRPPMPAATPEISSVMDRSRPRHTDDEIDDTSPETIVISVKPFSALPHKDKTSHRESTQGASLQRKHGSIDGSDGRPLSVMSTSKALPPAPPELLSAHDRVANLNARLDSLAHRRNNINRSIKQMTELMPNDNLLASAEVLRKREIEKMKVERLREELAEVQQEEYDIGLKLHRAYKRLDREAEFEPTGLWVRRVTG